jgi:hypothetical protein
LLQHVRPRGFVAFVSPGGTVWLIEDSANGGLFRVTPK